MPVSNFTELDAYKALNGSYDGEVVLVISEQLDIIEGVTFSNDVFVQIDKIIDHIKFKGCIFEKRFSIDDNLENIGEQKIRFLDFEGCEFLSDSSLDIRGETEFLKNLTFNWCKFNGNVSFQGLILEQLNFFGNIQIPEYLTEFNGRAFFDNIQVQQTYFNGVLFRSYINFKDCKETNFSFSSCVLESWLMFDKSFGNLTFSKIYRDFKKVDVIVPSRIEIKISSGMEDSKIHIDGLVNLDQLFITSSDKKNTVGEIRLHDISKSELPNSKFAFSNFTVKEFKYANSPRISGEVEFSDIHFESLSLESINLGESVFNGVKIGKLTLENATLNDCIFNGVTFDSYELGEEIGGEKIPLEKLKDNYRQLKHVMDKNCNYIEGNKFFALEMKYHLRYLDTVELFQNWKDFLSFDFYILKAENISQKITLTASKVLNNYGNNWLASVAWLIFLGFFSTVIHSYYVYLTGTSPKISVFKEVSTVYQIYKVYSWRGVFIVFWGSFFIIAKLWKFFEYTYPKLVFGFLGSEYTKISSYKRA